MERLTVTLGERSYPITIAAGLFNDPASFLPLKSGDQVMLVTNETLAPLYLDQVRTVLEQAGVKVDSVILPDGEQPLPRMAVLPRASVQIDPVWDTVGLAGTGSHDLLVDDAASAKQIKQNFRPVYTKAEYLALLDKYFS